MPTSDARKDCPLFLEETSGWLGFLCPLFSVGSDHHGACTADSLGDCSGVACRLTSWQKV
jgi:hypothetical protein